MSAIVTTLLDDLDAERAEVIDHLLGQPESAWCLPTPAVGWTVLDQVAHLVHFDGLAAQAMADPVGFAALRDSLGDLQTYVDGIGDLYRDRARGDILAEWEDSARRLRAAAEASDAKVRVPWFGPPMSVASKLTARVMETWAHGQDIFDGAGVVRLPTNRLRHVALIGVLAYANSFRTRGLAVPDVPVLVRLTSPDGDSWTWGDENAKDKVEGPAQDFCLVVTQRRHVDDTRLRTTGVTAAEWMRVAQAFAGPAGAGREPGQFGSPTGLAVSECPIGLNGAEPGRQDPRSRARDDREEARRV